MVLALGMEAPPLAFTAAPHDDPTKFVRATAVSVFGESWLE